LLLDDLLVGLLGSRVEAASVVVAVEHLRR
jgi:hypothetical protein